MIGRTSATQIVISLGLTFCNRRPGVSTEGPRGCIVPLWDGDPASGRSEGARGARTRGGRPLCLRVGRPSGGGPRAICTATMETPGCQLPRGTALLPQGVALRVIAPLDC